ncbi:hypothetical protein [Paenibacillus cremeus]|uniref:Uncharacterized protein n=1 Tax=Paenibacillus cremeus TaxID=2163881 RepID=A0A559K3V4_9BACL|nr:hypothetical protein [Paenibacillus cremeus]TVY06760.1 hypothetical protein FPZ49_27790 [Paenibacillus cremeus]
MYNQTNYQSSGNQNQYGAAGMSSAQSRNQASRYQPVGFVQSHYQPINQTSSFGASRQYTSAAQNISFQSQQAPQSFHMANYRGDQAGHDAYKRSDSSQPTQQSQYAAFNNTASFATTGYGMGTNNQSQSQYNQQQFNPQQFNQQQYNQQQSNQQQFNQYATPQSFHMANYQGDQQGHDAYKRSDSSQPTQSQYGMGASQYQYGSINNQSQYMSPQSFHTANYGMNQRQF